MYFFIPFLTIKVYFLFKFELYPYECIINFINLFIFSA